MNPTTITDSEDASLEKELLQTKQKLLAMSQEEQEARLVRLLHACMFTEDSINKETRTMIYAEASMWYAMLVMTGKIE